MKRKITLSIALLIALSAVALTDSDATVEAQNQLRYVADTGVVTLGPNQKLRVSLGDVNGDGAAFRARRIGYQSAGCANGVCRLAADPQDPTGTVYLTAGEAATVDFIGTDLSGTRITITSNDRNLKVNAMIIDTATGYVSSNNDIPMETFSLN